MNRIIPTTRRAFFFLFVFKEKGQEEGGEAGEEMGRRAIECRVGGEGALRVEDGEVAEEVGGRGDENDLGQQRLRLVNHGGSGRAQGIYIV